MLIVAVYLHQVFPASNNPWLLPHAAILTETWHYEFYISSAFFFSKHVPEFGHTFSVQACTCLAFLHSCYVVQKKLTNKGKLCGEAWKLCMSCDRANNYSEHCWRQARQGRRSTHTSEAHKSKTNQPLSKLWLTFSAPSFVNFEFWNFNYFEW